VILAKNRSALIEYLFRVLGFSIPIGSLINSLFNNISFFIQLKPFFTISENAGIKTKILIRVGINRPDIRRISVWIFAMADTFTVFKMSFRANPFESGASTLPLQQPLGYEFRIIKRA